MISQQIETKINLLTSLTVPLVWYNSKYCFIYEHRNKTTHTHTWIQIEPYRQAHKQSFESATRIFSMESTLKNHIQPKTKKNTQNNRRKPERNNIRQIKIEKKMNEKNQQPKKEREKQRR